MYAEIAGEFGLAADLETVADILGDRALKSDYIHPNAAGYRRLALAVADLLRAAGAVP
jgi:lysophospholipase L1-like esterase